MGYYIETEHNTGKGNWLMEHAKAIKTKLPQPATTTHIPVVVVHNRGFEAAGICYSPQKQREFTRSDDLRPKEFFMVPREEVFHLCPPVKVEMEW